MKKIILGIVFLLSILFANGQSGILVVKDPISLENTAVLNNNKLQLYKSPFYSDVLLWLGNYDGNDLVNEVGTNIPYVSGSGLDAIYDFSGLNDLRLNKNAYLGNSFSLPEYYDYPYSSEIYFDINNPYHWKLTDFHYANFLDQSLTVDNIAFLKAKATTNTSNVISSVSELFIYSTALVDNNLIKVKNYIGIQDDFYGDELLETLNFNDWSTFTQVTIDANNIFTSSGNGYGVILDNAFVCCKKYQIVLKGNTTSLGGIKLVNNSGGSTPLIYDFTTSGSFDISVDFTAEFTYLYIRNTNSGTTVVVEISIKEFYQNYYSQ